MKNRAKCKLCLSVIESFHRNDYVTCKCGEISISGGKETLECAAKNWGNFMRIDDQDNEIFVKVVEKMGEKTDETPIQETIIPCKTDLLQMLDDMIKSFERLPDHAMELPINHYDLYNYLIIISALLKKDS